MKPLINFLAALLLTPLAAHCADDTKIVRIFIFAGQSNADPAFIHLKAFSLPQQEEKLVITTAGILELGEVLARGYLEHK